MRSEVVYTALSVRQEVTGAVLPLVLGGALADLIGIHPVMVVLGLLALAAGALGLLLRRT